VLGLNVAALGVESLQSVLVDPLTNQYNLTLSNMVARSFSESLIMHLLMSSRVVIEKTKEF